MRESRVLDLVRSHPLISFHGHRVRGSWLENARSRGYSGLQMIEGREIHFRSSFGGQLRPYVCIAASSAFWRTLGPTLARDLRQEGLHPRPHVLDCIDRP